MLILLLRERLLYHDKNTMVQMNLFLTPGHWWCPNNPYMNELGTEEIEYYP
jgi:hypothetical protein